MKAQALKTWHVCDSYIMFNFLCSLYIYIVPELVALFPYADIEQINQYSVSESPACGVLCVMYTLS